MPEMTPEELKAQMDDRLEAMRAQTHGEGASSDVPPVDTQGEAPVPPEPMASPTGKFSSAAESFLRQPPAPPVPPRRSRGDELSGLMSEYENALAESNRRKAITGNATAMMALTAPHAAAAYGAQFEGYNNEPLDKISGKFKTAGAANQLEEQNSKIDYERDYGDAGSEVSRSAREVARKQLGLRNEDIPETMSAKDIEKILPNIRLLATQTGSTQRADARNETTSRIEQLREELKREEDKQKAEQEAFRQANKKAIADNRNATSRANTKDQVEAGYGKTILNVGLAQKEGGGSGGPGGQASRFTKSNVSGEAPFLVPKEGITPSKKSEADVDEMNGGMSVALGSMNRVLGILSGNNPWPGEEEWNTLSASLGEAGQAMNKIDKNGVMNFNDERNVMKELGNVNSPQEFLMRTADRQRGASIVKNTIARLKERYKSYVDSQGYAYSKTPGASPVVGGSGGSGSSPINKVTENILNQFAPKAGVDGPVVSPRWQPAQSQATQSQATIRVKNRKTGQTGTIGINKFDESIYERI